MPGTRCSCAARQFERRYKQDPIAPLCIRGEAGIARKLRHTDDLYEAGELLVVAACDDDPRIRTVQALIGADRGMRVAEPPRNDAGSEHRLPLVGKHALQA
ncbi:hypothetical protein GCM10007382_27150 [Salinibacterium xinjiangense]|nr:hypothetical protein GCM10007382_27150 [Salinibacterium xinjiangense]